MRDEVRYPAGTRDQRGTEGGERRERKRDGCRSGVSCPGSERSFREYLEGGEAQGHDLGLGGAAAPGPAQLCWEDTRGREITGPSRVGEKKGGRGGPHEYGTGGTKCELGVSIGNSAFTFLLHFYFKHRKRERKQIEKKCARKKREKKRLNCFCFFSGHTPPLPVFPPAFPTPSIASFQPPPPSPFFWGWDGVRGC